MEERIILHANEGMILTDGSTYGTTIYLAKGASAENYYEITKEEYQKMIEAEAEQHLVGMLI